jgi:hypothetical protein
VIAQVHRRQTVDWARVAADAGFHDQPHLVREFRAFAGLSPTQTLARQGDYANHVAMPVPAYRGRRKPRRNLQDTRRSVGYRCFGPSHRSIAMSLAKDTTCTIIPALRYRDAPAAIDWLCRAFGFEKRAVYADDQGGIMHAQLTFGRDMVMLSTARDDEWRGGASRCPATSAGARRRRRA